MWWIFLAPLLAVTFIYNFIKIYETFCKNRIINVSTGQSLQNSLSLWQSFKVTSEFNRPMALDLYDYTTKFNFEPFLFYFGHLPTIMFSSAKAAKDIFINYKDIEKFNMDASPVQKEFAVNSLVTMNGEEWERNRHVVVPAFANIDSLVTVFSSKAIQCIKQMEQESTVTNENYLIISPREFMTRMTLDVISTAGFGFDFNYINAFHVNTDNSKNNKEELFKKEALESYQYILSNGFHPKYLLFRELYYSLPFSDNLKMKKSLNIFNNLINEVIDKKRKEFKENGRLSQNTLLDLMIIATDSSDIDNDSKLTNQELHDNVVLFFIAGHETTSSNLSTLMYELAAYPKVQQKLYEEIHKVFPNSIVDNNTQNNNFKSFTVDDVIKIHSIEYLTSVINENLRLHPPAHMVEQRIISKRDIVIDGYKVPKGVCCNFNIYGLHHNPTIWGEDVNEFRPERFDKEESKERPSCSFLPFGLGQRKCLGNNFSLLEQKVFLIYLLNTFRLELVANTDNTMEDCKIEEGCIADSGVPYQRGGFLLTLNSNGKLKLVNRKYGITSEV
ncbi:hypothetical protein ABK040_000346 [Willaertia magna]